MSDKKYLFGDSKSKYEGLDKSEVETNYYNKSEVFSNDIIRIFHLSCENTQEQPWYMLEDIPAQSDLDGKQIIYLFFLTYARGSSLSKNVSFIADQIEYNSNNIIFASSNGGGVFVTFNYNSSGEGTGVSVSVTS